MGLNRLAVTVIIHLATHRPSQKHHLTPGGVLEGGSRTRTPTALRPLRARVPLRGVGDQGEADTPETDGEGSRDGSGGGERGRRAGRPERKEEKGARTAPSDRGSALARSRRVGGRKAGSPVSEGQSPEPRRQGPFAGPGTDPAFSDAAGAPREGVPAPARAAHSAQTG